MTKGVLISAISSGGGKTTVTLGIMRALLKRGLKIGGVKNGPDYIDPAFHQYATQNPSLNLDSFVMNDELIRHLAYRVGEGKDIIIAEGSMGLFDGVLRDIGKNGASADLAAKFGWPLILIIDSSASAQTLGAIALGMKNFDSRIKFGGVILNKIASDNHRRFAEEGLRRAGVPLLGVIMRNPDIKLPERHLGLVQANETENLEQILDNLADIIEKSVNLDEILKIADSNNHAQKLSDDIAMHMPVKRVAMAKDKAFSFIYPHLINSWRAQNVEILPFSPLNDEAPDEAADCVWLCGGYPELHAKTISENKNFIEGLREFAKTKPVHGECGGYMVLGESLTDKEGNEWEMAKLLPVKTSFAKRKMNLGYRHVILEDDCLIGKKGDNFMGHEFHYASIIESDDTKTLAKATDWEGKTKLNMGHISGNVSGSFFHLICKK